MHWIDHIELQTTLSQIREEVQSLAQEVALDGRVLGLRRIVALLNYLMEHLEMVCAEVDREPGKGEYRGRLESRPWISSSQRS